jgi:hypothetical protein
MTIKTRAFSGGSFAREYGLESIEVANGREALDQLEQDWE